jgi:hypothetical protein
MVVIAILQILWLVGSHRAFRPLSFTVMLHITGVLADTISKQPILNAAMQEAFTIVSIVIFVFMALLSLFMIGILLGCCEDVEVSNIAYSKIHNSSDGGRTTLHKSNNHLEDESNINNIQRDAMSIVKFGEGGDKGGDTSQQHAGLMTVNRQASSAF